QIVEISASGNFGVDAPVVFQLGDDLGLYDLPHVDVDSSHRSNHSLAHELFNLDKMRKSSSVISNEKRYSGFFADVDHLQALGMVASHGLLDIDRLTGGGGHAGQ